jgi:Transposase
VPFALPDALFFTGIDWAAGTPAVCVTDTAGKIAAEFTIEHSADGIAALTRRLTRYGEAGGMSAAIERPDGRLVDLLLEAGHPVVPVKPNAIKTWRDGEVLSGAKSDAGDAAVIAEYLRLRAHKLTAAPPVPMRPGRCAPWCAPAATWSRCGPRPPASCRRCWTRTGPAPRPSSPTSSRRSAWNS